MGEEFEAEIGWYIDRICYYDSIQKSSTADKSTRIKLYGKLEEYANLEGIKFLLGFWKESLNWYVKDEVERIVRKETSKLRKELCEKEEKIKGLLGLIK